MLLLFSAEVKLKELLSKADSCFQGNAREELLTRQFIRDLPEGIHLKLLEANPMTTLEEMAKFAKQFQAISQSDLMSVMFTTKKLLEMTIVSWHEILASSKKL